MRSYMEGKKYRENKGESAIMEKMKKYIILEEMEK